MNSESKLLPGLSITNSETLNCKRMPRIATTNGEVQQTKKGYDSGSQPFLSHAPF